MCRISKIIQQFLLSPLSEFQISVHEDPWQTLAVAMNASISYKELLDDMQFVWLFSCFNVSYLVPFPLRSQATDLHARRAAYMQGQTLHFSLHPRQLFPLHPRRQEEIISESYLNLTLKLQVSELQLPQWEAIVNRLQRLAVIAHLYVSLQVPM